MASSNWCKETDGKINYTKLCRLLVDGGTQVVRSVFDGIHPPSSLKAILNTNKTTLQKLKKPKGKVLNNEQWDTLYPPSGSIPKSEDFDITLLFVLLRNICGLTPPVYEITPCGKRKRSWDKLPHEMENSKEANLVRIKYYRNNIIAHKSSTEIKDVDFKQHWQDISSSLLSLGLSQDDIDDLKSACLGKKDYNQLLYDWYMSDKDIKTQLEVLKSDTAVIKSDTAGIKLDTADLKSDTAVIQSDTTDIKSDTADLKSDTADLKSDTTDIKSDIADLKDKLYDIRNVCSEAHKMDQLIHKLAISDFSQEICTKCKSFHLNSRQWILDQVKSHIDSDQPDSCIMLITAGPGMGKSTLAAKICQTYKDLGCLAGCHFFQFSNSTRNNPRLMLQSIARQMCDTVPGYREALESKLKTDLGKRITELDCEELLTILLEEPLCKVEQTDSNFVVVIDALDECSHEPKDKLLKALRKKLSCFPSWLRFILTSRPSINTSALGSTVAVEIRPEDESNIKDLELFFNFEFKALYPQYNDEYADVVQKLVELTKGLFLVAFFVIDFLKRENVGSPNKVLEEFPNGISSVYENYFSRLKEVLLPYISEEERFYKMLEAVVATNNPLPKKLFYNIVCLKSEREIPRQEKKTRKDALNALHWLFPVDGDHVTAFHKSVVDWLTLQEDEEHDFSVRAEDGNEVLTSQCNDALSDIRDGKKDLEKLLDLTDSEKYALRFLWDLVEKRSSVFKADKYGFISQNIYLLTALTIAYPSFSYCVSDSVMSRSLVGILQKVTGLFKIDCAHYSSCHFCRPSSFGRYLAFILQAAHARGVSEETTPNALDSLKKYLFPYFCEKSLLQTKGGFPVAISSLQYLFKCKDGFIAVLPLHHSNLLSTEVYIFQLDGRLVRSKSFLGKRLVTTSPNINFIVVAEENGNKIEILDVRTLEVVSQYESPHDAIETCHVFGDDQGCFIVMKGCHDNKVYVIKGLTGEVHNTIQVTEDSTVMDVSCQGHVVVTRTWESYEPEKLNTFINKDGEVKLMDWRTNERYPHPGMYPRFGLQEPHEIEYIYRELLLYHYDRGQEPIPIYPLVEEICHCPSTWRDYFAVDEAVHVSEDGLLLAYRYKDSIFIVNTSDGSLFKRLSFAGTFQFRSLSSGGTLKVWVAYFDILFVSESYLVVIDDDVMSVINVQTDEIQHKIFLLHSALPNRKQYLVYSEEEGKSFNLISKHFHHFLGGYKVSRLVFHNLNLQGLR